MPNDFISQVGRGLLPDRRSRRFLKELRDHTEDSGGRTDRLGKPEELTRFYRKLHPVWPRFLLFFFLILITSFLLSAGEYTFLTDETSAESLVISEPYGSIIGAASLVGMYMMLVAVPLVLPLFPILGELYFAALPFMAFGLWAIIFAVLILPTPWQTASLIASRLNNFIDSPR